MVNWEPQFKTPPHRAEDGHILCILLIHIAFYYVSKNLSFLYLLNIHHLAYTFSYGYTEAHAHKHTCIISTLAEWRQPDTWAWPRKAEERLLFETKALHTHKKSMKKKSMSVRTDIHEFKRNRFKHIELPLKLLDYFYAAVKTTSINYVGLSWFYVAGLFWVYLGLLGTGLFGKCVGLSWVCKVLFCVGLFWVYVGLFWMRIRLLGIGIFGEYVELNKSFTIQQLM